VFSEKSPQSQSQDKAAACCAGNAPRGKPVGIAVKGAPTASCC